MKNIFVLAIVSMVIFSCKKDSNFTSRITFLNGAIEAMPFTIHLSEDPVISNVAFADIQPFVRVPSGTFNIRFFHGSGTVPYGTLVSSFESGRDYTCFLFDSIAKHKIFFQKDVLPQKITDGKCVLRFFSLVPNTTNLSLQNDTGKIFIRDKSFGGYTPSFAEIDTTSRKLKIVMLPGTILLDNIEQQLSAGKIYSLFITGSLNGAGIEQPKVSFITHN